MSSLLFPSSVRHSSLFLNDFPANLRRDDFFNHSYVECLLYSFLRRYDIILFFGMIFQPTFFVITSIVIHMLSKHLCISFLGMTTFVFPSSRCLLCSFLPRYDILLFFLNDFPANLLRDDFFYHSSVECLLYSFLTRYDIFLYFWMSFQPTFFVITSIVIPMLSKHLCISFLGMTTFVFLHQDVFFALSFLVNVFVFLSCDDYICFSFFKMSSLLFPYAMSSLLFPSSVRHSSRFLNDFPANLLRDDFFYHSSVECLLYSFLTRYDIFLYFWMIFQPTFFVITSIVIPMLSKHLCISFLGMTTFVFPSSRCLLCSFLPRYDILLFF
ncbi:unnamed protein product [Acanthosepion pharaonis]|uniref:Uncharacterized protein n=1 Tax=Acanthosepion pharaonis TaxID=158019 RepID=A0A812EPQ4_ACAPH|nr:unnamed protein product [Sepia pharaonis]